MIYIRNLFKQDLRDGKQIAFPSNPSNYIFKFSFKNQDPDRNITFKFRERDNTSQNFIHNNKIIKTRLYSAGSESRIDSELKQFLINVLGAEENDIILIRPINIQNYKFYKEDINNRTAIKNIINKYNPKIIYNLAAETHVDRSIDAPSAFIQSNIIGTYELLEASRNYWIKQGQPINFRFHHISTDEVYGSLGKSGLFTESTPYDPKSPYSASKASSDHLVRAWHKTYGLPVIITNCSNNYGPFHFPEKLIPVVILKAISGEKIPIYGKGDNIRDWLYVEDHANALLTVIMNGKVGRTYNIGGENEATNLDLVKKICTLLDELLPQEKPYAEQIIFVPDRPGHDQRYAIDPSRIRNELGWRPSVTLDEGLRKTVLWYLENKDWWQALQSREGVGSRLGSIK